MSQPAASIPQAVHCCWPISLHQHMPLQRHVSMCDLSRNLLQGSLGHQVFRLVSHLCWGAQRKESVANCTICSVPIGAPPYSPVPLELSDVIFVAPLEGGLEQPQGKEHTNGDLGLSLYPSTLHRHANNVEPSGGAYACVQHSGGGRRIGRSRRSLPKRF